MKKRELGNTGIQVSEIGLGLWAIGGGAWGEVDDQDSLNLIDYALDAGVNFFDTSDVYNEGHSEGVLGKTMQGRRERFIVATKIGWQNFDDVNKVSAYDTVEKLITGVETNLERLGTDYIDVMQCHIDFREPNMEVFLEGFQKLKQDGKVRAYGVSTSDFEYLKAFNHDGGCSTLQIDYSILNRTAEEEIFPYCQANDISTIIRGPLAMGILTGKFTLDQTFEPGDFRNSWINVPEENAIYRSDLDKVEQLKRLVIKGRSLTQLAVQFTLQNPAVTTVIPGAKTEQQFSETRAAIDSPLLTAEELAIIDELTPPSGGRKIWPA
jgi:aryl-alcohol dehydrogenase-like predicted oxidoreductase